MIDGCRPSGASKCLPQCVVCVGCPASGRASGTSNRSTASSSPLEKRLTVTTPCNQNGRLGPRWSREQIRAARLAPLVPLLQQRGLQVVEREAGNFILPAYPGLIVCVLSNAALSISAYFGLYYRKRLGAMPYRYTFLGAAGPYGCQCSIQPRCNRRIRPCPKHRFLFRPPVRRAPPHT